MKEKRYEKKKQLFSIIYFEYIVNPIQPSLIKVH